MAGRLILPALLGLAAAAAAPAPTGVTEIAAGVFVRTGVIADAAPDNDDAIANVGFIVGDAAVAVIDVGGSGPDGAALRAAVRAATDRPVRYVILTHVHPDHVFGGGAFAADRPVVVGHARLAAQLAARADYYRRRLGETLGAARAGDTLAPTLAVADRADLDLGGRVLTVEAHRPAHSGSDLTVFDRRTSTLWAGDLLFVDRVPALDGSLTGWLAELAALTAQPAARAVPGHGPAAVAWPAAAAPEIRYLETLARDVRAVLARGGDIDAAILGAAAGERGRWLLFDDYNGRNVTQAFKELEWE